MKEIRVSEAAVGDIEAMSRQVARSYCAAYRGLMREDYLSALTEDHWVPILKEAMGAGCTCLAAWHGADMVGSIVFGQSAAENVPGVAEVFALYLLPTHVDLGIGKALYQAAEARICAAGYTACVAEVLCENMRSIRFCTRQGFQVTGEFSVEENGMLLHCKTLRKEWKKGSLPHEDRH